MCSPLLVRVLKITLKSTHDGVFLLLLRKDHPTIRKIFCTKRCVRAARASSEYKVSVCEGSSLLLYIHTSILFSKVTSVSNHGVCAYSSKNFTLACDESRAPPLRLKVACRTQRETAPLLLKIPPPALMSVPVLSKNGSSRGDDWSSSTRGIVSAQKEQDLPT